MSGWPVTFDTNCRHALAVMTFLNLLLSLRLCLFNFSFLDFVPFPHVTDGITVGSSNSTLGCWAMYSMSRSKCPFTLFKLELSSLKSLDPKPTTSTIYSNFFLNSSTSCLICVRVFSVSRFPLSPITLVFLLPNLLFCSRLASKSFWKFRFLVVL